MSDYETRLKSIEDRLSRIEQYLDRVKEVDRKFISMMSHEEKAKAEEYLKQIGLG